MGNAAARASAQALVASQIARMPESQARNVLAIYGPVAIMAIHVCKKIGLLPRRDT
jgi:hypothetical protein